MADNPPKSVDPTTPPTSSLPLLDNTLNTLIPTLSILEKFHHRQRNQHRVAKWYSKSDMLRRHLRKFLAAAEERRREVEVLERMRKFVGGGKAKKKRVEGGEGRGGEGDKKGEGRKMGRWEEEVVERAAYLRNLSQGCYLAFTQLLADKQFAHLALMLLGVLAQVQAAVAPFAPPLPEDSPQADIPQQDKRLQGEQAIPDMGIPVSREDVSRGGAEALGVPVARSEAMGELVSRPEVSVEPSEPRDRPQETVEFYSPVREEVPKARKKKKMEDEFDDIFGGLERSSKRPKKKKKKGDEFDDIFSGL